ncbi:kinase-like protein [Parathielavia appendiculata]|uniref:non-specific serine/threonine protein kinase n=1 Tax=Parathielavia appendiculata TaxID=2587402 RepID=A0AAN6TYY5_9PEZI|nr:kinase-like protein [Parathielavia appendiculata]
MTQELIKYPPGFCMKDVLAWGSTGLVLHDEDSQTVIKTHLGDDDDPLASREREVYERLAQRGGHRRVLRYHGTVESGIRLEYASNDGIRTLCNQRERAAISSGQRLRWTTQISEAAGFIHSAGVIHGDLTCQNIFPDQKLDIKLGDFAGSSIDGSGLLVAVTPSHECSGSPLSTQRDIFAFGSVIYELMTGSAPYQGFSDTEINARNKNGQFADTTSLGELGAIIRSSISLHVNQVRV